MTTPPVKKARPLSPHLQIYRPQLTMGLSIFHRGTGMALAAGLLVFVAWLIALAEGPHAYAQFMGYAMSVMGQICLLGWTFAFFFHFCMGIRHLFWDAGLFLDLKQAYRTGYIALLSAIILTAGLWAHCVWCRP